MSKFKSQLIGVAGAVAVAGGQAHAQANAQSSANIGEVVVTATKRALAVQDVPAAIGVVGGGVIDQLQIKTFTDLSRLDPSLQFSSNGIGNSRITVRGIQATGAATAALYLDEADITGQTFESSTGGAQPDIGLHDIDRVEVLKGPQGTLFGASSMSGAVRIITKKPTLDDYHGVAAVGGSFGSGTNALYEADGAINVPIVKDQLAVRLVGWESTGGGYVDSVSSGQKNINDAKIGGARGTVLWRPVNRLSVTLMSVYQHIKVDGSQRYEATLGPYLNNSPTPEPSEENLKLFSGVAVYDLGFGAITGTSSYIERQTDFLYDTSPTANSFGLAGAYESLNSAKRAVSFSEVRFASAFKGPLQVVVGAAYHDDLNKFESVVSKTTLNSLPVCYAYASCIALNQTNAVVSARRVHSTFISTALFGEADYKLSDKLTLTAGLRLFNSKQHNIEYTVQKLRATGNPATIQTTPVLAVNLADKQNKPSYNFAVAYKADENLSLYARAASGFRQGGINNAAFAANFGTTISAGYNPDEVWNYEVGAKGSLFQNFLTFEGALYHIDWKNQQVPAVSANGAFTFITNAGKSVVNGVELEGVVRPIEGLKLTLATAYTDAHLTENQPPTSGNTNAPGKDGDRIPYVSKWTWTGQAEYTWPAFETWNAYVHGDFNYRSRAYTFFNAVNPFYKPVADYVLADLGVGIRNERWDVSLLVQNVTDKAAVLSVQPNTDGYRITGTRPRTFGVNVRANF